MRIKGINHLALVCRDMQETVDFYSGVLGIFSAMIWRAAGHGERFPFGPALAASLFFCVILPQLANGFWQLYGLLH